MDRTLKHPQTQIYMCLDCKHDYFLFSSNSIYNEIENFKLSSIGKDKVRNLILVD